MSTSTPEGTGAPAGTGPTQPPAFAPPASQADLDRIIADRISRERAKFGDYDALKAKASEFDKLADAQKTALQKAQDRAAAAEKVAADLKARDQRAAWAEEITKGSTVPAKALRGTTQEELREHFEQIKALIPDLPPQKGALGPYVPGVGTTPTGTLGGPAQEFADWFSGQLGR